MPKATSKPNCKKGYSCGASCIQQSKGCSNSLQGLGKRFAEWLFFWRKPQQQPKSTKDGLPSGVNRRETRKASYYTFKAGDRKVEMQVSTEPGFVQAVSFKVSSSYDISSLPANVRNEASIKLSRILQYHVSRQADGTMMGCSAWTRDGQGSYRALAYTRIGFSRPLNAEPGSAQYAVIKNGRIDAEVTQAVLQRKEGSAFEDYERGWQSVLEDVRSRRQAARSSRRSA